jgi:hypothetical protein
MDAAAIEAAQATLDKQRAAYESPFLQPIFDGASDPAVVAWVAKVAEAYAGLPAGHARNLITALHFALLHTPNTLKEQLEKNAALNV